MLPEVVDDASDRTPRRPIDWLRFAPFLALVCAAFAWLKSAQYHGLGQLRDEQAEALLFLIVSLSSVILTLARFGRYRCEGRRKFIGIVVVCVVVVVCDVLAAWNLSTATLGAKDRLW